METAPKLVERPTPRIAINALADYLVAGAAGRRRILKTQKRPKPFVTSTYRRAEDAIIRYLEGRREDKEILLAARQDFLRRPARSADEAQKLRLCAEAVSAFLRDDPLPALEIENLELRRAPRSQPKLVIAGVRVSVRPELVLSWVDRKGQAKVGAIKLHFPKTNPLTREAGEYVSTAVHEHLHAHATSQTKVDHQQCLVLDVFSGRVFAAPRARARRVADLEAACEEIASRWATI